MSCITDNPEPLFSSSDPSPSTTPSSATFRLSSSGLTPSSSPPATFNQLFSAPTPTPPPPNYLTNVPQHMAQFNGSHHAPHVLVPVPEDMSMRPRSISEGSFFKSLEHPTPAHFNGHPAPNQSQAMLAWITSFVRSKGGCITAANLGSALARIHPEFYGMIKNYHGGLTAFLGDYPDRFIFANDPPFNHVILTSHKELIAQHPPSPPSPLRTQVPMMKSMGSASLASSLQARQPPPQQAIALHPSLQYNANMAAWSSTILDRQFEADVVRATAEILCNAASCSLKAVELANTLRARLGTKVLAKVREKYGGLLFMLERHQNLFRVDRIPKNDCVTLMPKGLLLSQQQHPVQITFPPPPYPPPPTQLIHCTSGPMPGYPDHAAKLMDDRTKNMTMLSIDTLEVS